MSRQYWSQRNNRGPIARLTLEKLSRLFSVIVGQAWQKDYLQEWFGYYCVDGLGDGWTAGQAGDEGATFVESLTGWDGVWPVHEHASNYSEEGLFDMIEFLHDHVSEGDEGYHHDFNGCGWHYRTFKSEPAQVWFRDSINRHLEAYGAGYVLDGSGRIERAAPSGLDNLLLTPVVTTEAEIAGRVATAIDKYRRRGGTSADRRDAVRDLFDVLERLKPELKQHLMTADEKDLFQIANRFSIRHFDASQRGEYNTELWWSWMFYVNLATIHLVTRKVTGQSTTPISELPVNTGQPV
jgi:hypothetical protein